MAIQGETIYDVDGGPKIIRAQVEQPSSFLRRLTDGRNETLRKLIDLKVPVIEQAPYEKERFYLFKQATAGGAGSITFAFNPPPPFPSFRLNYLLLIPETTASRQYQLQIFKDAGSGALGVLQGARMFSGNTNDNPFPLVAPGGPTTFYRSADDTLWNWVSGPIDFYRNYRKDEETAANRERFQVTGANITLTETVGIYAELEAIPEPAAMRDLSELTTASAV